MKIKTLTKEELKQRLLQRDVLIPTSMFVGGFIFDVFTTGRIDTLFVILQQFVYLTLATGLLSSLFLKQEWVVEGSPKVTKILEYRLAALHFLFGALLSAFMIFYFKSSSFTVSFLFLAFIAGLLIANELPRFQKLGYGIKSAILALCFVSYFSYVVPVVIGSIGALVFLVSIFISGIHFFGIFKILERKKLESQVLKRQLLIPMGFVMTLFTVIYFLKILPPVPLSLQYIGVYHSVEKTEDGKYKLGHDNGWWNFWSNGSQSFTKSETNPLYVFFRLFAPSHFQEQVQLQWEWKNRLGNWEVQDRIPISISGGRDEGFRGYGQKNNYQSGQWRTKVLTSDGREIGRISFEVNEGPGLGEMKFDFH